MAGSYGSTSPLRTFHSALRSNRFGTTASLSLATVNSWRTTSVWCLQATPWTGGPAICWTVWRPKKKCRRSCNILVNLAQRGLPDVQDFPQKRPKTRMLNFGFVVIGMNNSANATSHGLKPSPVLEPMRHRCLPPTIRGSRTSPSNGCLRFSRNSNRASSNRLESSRTHPMVLVPCQATDNCV